MRSLPSSTPSGSRILLRPDFTCYETYVEGRPEMSLKTLRVTRWARQMNAAQSVDAE